MSVTSWPLNKGTDPDWYRDHENLAELWRHLIAIGEAPTDNVGRFLEKPWRWQAEWQRYCEQS